MTGSAHEYTATLVVGEDEYPLGIRRAGRIVLDDGRAPHVEANVDIALPDEALQLVLDPRQAARVRLDVTATFPTTTQTRTFDLSLRSRPIRHGRGAFGRVTLASDEALLETFRAGADVDLFDLAGSLRDVINNVLAAVIPGAALEATPDADADVTPYWEVTNLITNPSAEVNTTGWGAGTGTSAVSRITGAVPPTVSGVATFRWTASAATAYISGTTSYPVRAGERHVFSGWVLAGKGGLNKDYQPMIRFVDAGGATIRDVFGPVVGSTTEWERFEQIAEAPAGARSATLHIRSFGNAVGEFSYCDALMFHEGDRAVPYFDGAQPDDANYSYEWSGDTAHASPSVRVPFVERRPEALVWRAGDSALDFLHPLVQAAGLRLVCDGERRWTLRGENYSAPGTLSVREGVNMIEGEDVIDLDRGLWCDAQATIYRDPARVLPDQVDYYELNSPPTVVNRVVVDAAYVGPGRSEYAVRRAQGRGREVTVTLVADWRTHAEQPARFTLEGAPVQLGRTSRVAFDLATDRMDVASRTSDLIEGSVDALLGTVDALVGTVNDL
ncbi:hypothetical protein [Microbacterium immunditiarum]|uniref:CBM-cenC domain-containing protein n=1 Tax=Microbacterium immunditiarum TaxID=337480 RepID=A0A7Y9GPV4_9MICO|nr:hypothetical protein [Microbacterium immunditiarum]NYE20509.1 hypothetical protein [Microbacterium immunditiarum]